MRLGFSINAIRFSICCAFLFGAAGGSPAIADAPAWSSSDPLSIPYELRLQQLEKGNLVINPSFEPDANPVDGTNRRSVPPGWEKVGNRVAWVDRGSGGAPDEVHEGRGAIKVHRDRAGELDAAEGIISDYIPVIPGNYDFTYAVRLKQGPAIWSSWPVKPPSATSTPPLPPPSSSTRTAASTTALPLSTLLIL